MRVIRYETERGNMIDSCFYRKSIFLAGPTVRGHQQHLGPSWRFDAINELEKLNFQGSVIVPEFSDPSKSDKGKAWIPRWEDAGMRMCGGLLFWIPRTRELIGLTTNFELGYWMNDPKTFYGRPDGAYRTDYLDNVWENYPHYGKKRRPPIHNNLGELCSSVVNYIDSKYPK